MDFNSEHLPAVRLYAETDWTNPVNDLLMFGHRVTGCNYMAEINSTAVYVEGDLSPYIIMAGGRFSDFYVRLVPERIERNGIALIVWWNDGTKTVVKLHDEDWDTEKGLAMALARKMWGRSKTVKYTGMLKDQKGDGDAGRS